MAWCARSAGWYTLKFVSLCDLLKRAEMLADTVNRDGGSERLGVDVRSSCSRTCDQE